ncbi:MAG: MFS transporter [Coxiellaceae bacterium]|nr:MFS transporter [Coxiellaceae bacterium]
MKNNNRRAWAIWALASAFFFAEYFARVSPSVMIRPLMIALNVNAYQLGSLSAFFYYAYVAMQLPVGALMDRFGPRWLLTAMALLCGISCLVFANVHILAVAKLTRFLMGFSAAFAFVGALKLASVWFPVQRFGFFAGATQAMGMWGAAVGEGPVSVLVNHMGWRHTMELIGFILVALAIAIVIVVRDRPKNVSKQAQQVSGRSFGLLSGLWRVLCNSQTWINGVFAGFIYAPTVAFAELWGPSYLHRVYGMSLEQAASAVSLIFIGWAIGSPIMGWVSDHIRGRKPVMIFAAFMSMLMLSATLYIPHLPELMVFVLLFLYGLFNSGLSVSYAVACEINPHAIAGTSMSFANMASVIIGALFQPVIGWLLDLHWSGNIQQGVRLYSAADFRYAMIALPVCFIISLLMMFWLRESFKITSKAGSA